MSYTNKTSGELEINFISSAVGLVKKTATISDAGVTPNELGNKIVKAGTIYPANDATAKGIVTMNTDVTWGDVAGSIIIAGRILEDRLPETLDADAKEALEVNGMYFDESPETEREV